MPSQVNLPHALDRAMNAAFTWIDRQRQKVGEARLRLHQRNESQAVHREASTGRQAPRRALLVTREAPSQRKN